MTIRERIDNTMFEHLRLAVVAAGYLPDAAAMADEAAYETARTALLTTKEQLIEIFGYGSADSRLERAMSRITVDRCEQHNGDIGSWAVEEHQAYEESPGVNKYKRIRYPSGTYDLEYEVRVVSDKQKFESIMEDIVTSVFGFRKFVQLINDAGVPNGEPMLVECTGEVNLSNGKTSEKMYRFICKDVWLEAFTELATGIVPLTSVEISYYLKPNTAGAAAETITTNFTP